MTTERTEADPLGWHGSRRDVLYVATGLFGAAGMAGALWPLIHSMNPDTDTIARHLVDVDLRDIASGQRKTVEWRGSPVFICHRTPEEIAAARSTRLAVLEDRQTDEERVQQAEWLVVAGLCTQDGCVPLGQRPDEPRGDWGGWICPCCGSSYDTSGRVRRSIAPRNLYSIDHIFLSDGSLRIGNRRYLHDPYLISPRNGGS